MDFIAKLIYIKTILAIFIICHWNGTGTWNHSLWETTIHCVYIVNITTADDLSTQRIKASVAILASVTEEWIITLDKIPASFCSPWHHGVPKQHCNTVYKTMKIGPIWTPTSGWQITTASTDHAYSRLHWEKNGRFYMGEKRWNRNL